jgi:hypothetical protein
MKGAGASNPPVPLSVSARVREPAEAEALDRRQRQIAAIARLLRRAVEERTLPEER